MNHVDLALVREVTRCFTNLAGNYDTHYQLMESDVADALTKSLRNPDAIVTRFAAVGIVNLTAVPENQAAFLASGAHEVMTELALGEPRSWNDLNDDGDNADNNNGLNDEDLEDLPPSNVDEETGALVAADPVRREAAAAALPRSKRARAPTGALAPIAAFERSAQAQRSTTCCRI